MSDERPESPSESEVNSLLDEDNEEEAPQTEAQQDKVKLRFEKDVAEMIIMVETAANRKPNATSSTLDAAVDAEKARVPSEYMKSFIDERIKQWSDTDNTTSDHRNFLHFLAYNTTKAKSVSKFIATVISRPELIAVDAMCKKDSSLRTPLAVAIGEHNLNFISAACLGVHVNRARKFAQNLSWEGRGSGNAADSFDATCLHSALRKLSTLDNITPNFVKSIIGMIDFMPTEMFEIEDLQKHTPLHLAVEYDRGRAEPKDHEQIISKLLDRVQDSQETATLHQYNFYQYHDETRQDAELRLKRSSSLHPKETAASRKGEKVPEIRNNIPETKEGGKTGPPQDNTRPPVGPNIGQARRRDSVSFAGGKTPNDRGMTRDPESLTTLLQGDKLMASLAFGYRDTLAQRQVSPIPPQKSGDEERRKVNADKTEEMLKQAYLRLMKPHQARAKLHVPGKKDKELWFDFGPRPVPQKQMTIKDFTAHFDLFKHLEFDKMLQYVAFPKLEIILEEDSDIRYSGSTHLRWFFVDWLKNKAGVKRILKVEVDDMPSETPSHSDDAIGRSLEPFGVETLDWRKPDLCPLLISRVGKSLRDVTLQWGGSNAVLRAWSEPEGLPLTPSLRSIHIVHKQGLESKENTNLRVEQFKERLKNSWTTVHTKIDKRGRTTCTPVPSVDVVDLHDGHGYLYTRGRQGTHFTTASPSADSRLQEQHIDPQKWMTCMTTFAEAFRQIKGIHDKPNNNALHPVTVALIDDGVDIGHPELQVRPSRQEKARSFPGKSFDPFQDDSRISPYWLSRGGHGTLMARLIHKIAPSAVIYVIKLKTEETASSAKLQIEPKSAIQAIQHAIELGVQVISMSWTTKPLENQTDRESFDKVIQDAHKKGILMFCSASDNGNFEEFTYPYSASPGTVFRIGAASKDGTIPTFVGGDINFILPGQDVTIKDEDDPGATQNQSDSSAPRTGSSVATALAAGLAALVIECVRLAAKHAMDGNRTARDPDAIVLSDLTEIRKKRTMEEAFYAIGYNNRSKDNKYVEVWKTFDVPAGRLKGRGGVTSDELDDIVGLARLFLRKGAK